MSQQIKIKVRPNETMRFPGLCVHCSHPAAESIELRQRNGRTMRQIEVPLCEECSSQLRRESGEEERLRKIGRLSTAAAAVLVAVLLLILPVLDVFWIRLILALTGGVAAAVFVRWLFQGLIEQAALPEKKAIRESARMESFSWRTATFVFSNESFAERFIELNEPLLVEM